MKILGTISAMEQKPAVGVDEHNLAANFDFAWYLNPKVDQRQVNKEPPRKFVSAKFGASQTS
jgi:hypothetical protein